MSQILYNIDTENICDGELERYRISGWAAGINGKAAKIRVVNENGQIIPFECVYVERPDVVKQVKKLSNGEVAVGFELCISDWMDVLRNNEKLIVIANDGENDKNIYYKKTEELRKSMDVQSMQLNIDAYSKNEKEIQIRGWVFDRQAEVRLEFFDASGKKLSAEVRWSRRLDVENLFALQHQPLTGFVAIIPVSETNGGEITVKASAELRQREECVNPDKPIKAKASHAWMAKLKEPENWKKGIIYLQKHGFKALYHKLQGMSIDPDTAYAMWFAAHRVTPEQLEEQKNIAFTICPKISIVIPLYNTQIPFLKAILDSIVNQSYANWELCLADGSTVDEVGDYIREHYSGEERIRYERLSENLGIAGNTNKALSMATGDYVMLTDHDDLLELDALFEMVKLINEDPELEIIYTDEDLTDETGEKFTSPRFKPDYNLDFLRSINYICHIFMVKKEIMDQVGGFRKEFDGAQDWDMILRCCELTEHIGHVPKILYHWRAYEASTAGNPESKLYAIDAGKAALEEHYKRLGIDARLEYTDIFIMFRTIMKVKGTPKVSIIICNKDEVPTLKTCVESILNKSTYGNYEIIIVENNSTDEKTFAYYKELEKKDERIQVVYYKEEFNYSKVNNFGAKYATGDYYILLNNDTEVITPNWIEQMVGYCQREDVGIVGAKLLYPDNTVQHCGVVIGVGGFAGHILTQSSREDVGYFGRLQAIQDISAVTAACLMIKKSVFDEVGGLTESFKVALNDIDLCLKAREKGYLIVMNPGVELYHYESKSRGMEETPEKHERFKGEISRFRDRWKDILEKGDPYYNPNLTLMYGDCRLRGEDEHFDIIDEIEADKKNSYKKGQQNG